MVDEGDAAELQSPALNLIERGSMLLSHFRPADIDAPTFTDDRNGFMSAVALALLVSACLWIAIAGVAAALIAIVQRVAAL